jgi:hypothetical protein
VREGTKLDLSIVESTRKALLDAKAITYSDSSTDGRAVRVMLFVAVHESGIGPSRRNGDFRSQGPGSWEQNRRDMLSLRLIDFDPRREPAWAVAVLREALTERTRERVSLDGQDPVQSGQCANAAHSSLSPTGVSA